MKKTLLFLLILIRMSCFSQISNLTACDDNNDGFSVFNLNVQTPILISAQPVGNYIISYHLSLANATNNTNAIANPAAYTNISSPQIIYARIRNTVNGNIATNYFSLIVNNSPIISHPNNVTFCGSYYLPSLANGNYYTAPNGTGSLILPGTAIISSQILYIYAQSGSCSSQSSFMLTVLPQPNPVLQNAVLCTDANNSHLLDTGLNSSEYLFSWKFNDVVIAGANGSSYLATIPGNYCVTVSNFVSCQTTVCSQVTLSSIPVISASVNGQTITVSASGLGNYEFQLDSGLYQSSPVFESAPSGNHVISVRDLNGCGVAQISIQLTLGFEENNFRNFTCYPNPVKNLMSIRNTNNIDTLTIYNIMGQSLLETKANSAEVQLDLSGLESGVYSIKIKSGNQVKIQKVIIE